MSSDKTDSESDGDDIEDKELNVFYQMINENIIYSVPNIKWDYDSQKVPKEQTQSNELYRYDFNDYNHLQTQQKKQRNNQAKVNSNALTI